MAEKLKAYSSEWYRQKKLQDPEWYEKRKAYNRERSKRFYHADREIRLDDCVDEVIRLSKLNDRVAVKQYIKDNFTLKYKKG